jgi:hypothetical protein
MKPVLVKSGAAVAVVAALVVVAVAAAAVVAAVSTGASHAGNSYFNTRRPPGVSGGLFVSTLLN